MKFYHFLFLLILMSITIVVGQNMCNIERDMECATIGEVKEAADKDSLEDTIREAGDRMIPDLMDEAMSHLGKRYSYGGKGPKTFDCSGFTSYVFRQLYGTEIGHSSSEQYARHSPIERSDMQPGDLVFFTSPRSGRQVGHVGIVVDYDTSTTDFRFIHASINEGIKISKSTDDYYDRRFVGVRRVSDTLSIAMVGDIMMGTTFPSMMLPDNEGADLFKDASPLLVDADLAVGNLEGVLCDGGKSTKGTGPNSYAFRTPTSYAPLLKQAGFDYLGQANNHANDFGKEGIESTERCLCEQGILFSGIEGRTESAVIERKGKKIGLCAFGHNSYTLKHVEMETVGRIVDNLVKECDIVIVSVHGGAEGRTQSHLPMGSETFLGENRGSLRELAHFCIEHGADVIYGHGPHVVRCLEVYKGRFIAYSLGNFCTPYNVSLTGISGYAPLIEIEIDSQGRFLSGQIHPMIQERGIGPRHDKTGRVVQQIKQLSDEDVPQSEAVVWPDGQIRMK